MPPSRIRNATEVDEELSHVPTTESAKPIVIGQTKSLIDMTSLMDLLRHATESSTGVTFVAPAGASKDAIDAKILTYESLLDIAERNSQSIRQFASDHGANIVLIHMESIADNIEMFWSVVKAGLIPAMSTPLSADVDQRQTHLRHLKGLLNHPICLTSKALTEKIPELQVFNIIVKESLVEQQINAPPNASAPINGSPVALMLTSGSTGNAKAVELTVDQIFASIRGKSGNWRSDGDSVFLNWIGLDHVANLVEIHMQAMLHGAQQIHVQASDLLADPMLFLRIIDEYRVNYTFAPNFFLSLLEKDLISSDASAPIHSINLSCLRSIMSGGEANVVETANRLTRRLQDLGAQGQIIRLGYGLTEACAALAYGMLDPDYEAEENHQFASIGKPIDGAKMRVLGDSSTEARAYEVGALEISGPVVFQKYFNNLGATEDAFTPDGWFRTGDRAYTDSFGKFNLVGRSKEVLNINGVKFAPQDIETVLEKANLTNVLASYYAAFPYRKEGGNTEGYCIVYCVKVHDFDTIEQIARISSSLVSARPDWIIPLSQTRLDRSSLGKLSRTKLQAMFVKGVYDDAKIDSTHPLNLYHTGPRQLPQTITQQRVFEVLSQMLDVPEELISTDQTVFELGVTSVSLFRFEKLLRKRFEMGKGEYNFLQKYCSLLQPISFVSPHPRKNAKTSAWQGSQ